MFASLAITCLGVQAGGNLAPTEKVSVGFRLANALVSYVRYLGEMIWPVNLAVLYPMPSHWAAWQVGGALLLLLGISLLTLARLRSAPYLAVGWAFLSRHTGAGDWPASGRPRRHGRPLYLHSGNRLVRCRRVGGG